MPNNITIFTFENFAQSVNKTITENESNLFRTTLDKEELWEHYLKSYPSEANEIYRERGRYDCNTCKRFIQQVGGLVWVDDDLNMHTIWEQSFEVGYPYGGVAKSMHNYIIANADVKNVFLANSRYQVMIGEQENYEYGDSEIINTWNHFWFEPSRVVSGDIIGTLFAKYKSAFESTYRSLLDINESSIDLVLELCNDNNLYKGAEHIEKLEILKKLKSDTIDLTDEHKTLYVWKYVKNKSAVVHSFRTSLIGTLLVDLSNGEDLEVAVNKYESKAAPENYQHKRKIATRSQIKKAEERLVEMGMVDSLLRRTAKLSDIAIDDVLFADQKVHGQMKESLSGLSIFQDLEIESQNKHQVNVDLSKVEEMSIDDFINNLLPKVTSIEAYVDKNHKNNFVTLVAPSVQQAKPLTPWKNNFTWAYIKNLASSSFIKERVKNVGGKVDCDGRISLLWDNHDDYDLHAYIGSHRIDYMNTYVRELGACLDVDENYRRIVDNPVENIYFDDLSKLEGKTITVEVTVASSKRKTTLMRDEWYVELEFNGEMVRIEMNYVLKSRKNVVRFKIKGGKLELIDLNEGRIVESVEIPQEVWGIKSNNFVPVTMIMNSPNHWKNDVNTGTKHVMFMLKDCVNDDKVRGFFNEFLRAELKSDKAVFEMLGNRMKAESDENQLSGLGFNTTQKGYIVLKLNGKMKNKLVKVTFA